jgi:hypothetical protein
LDHLVLLKKKEISKYLLKTFRLTKASLNRDKFGNLCDRNALSVRKASFKQGSGT